ncbi:Doxorubicin resistance ATP-binding protein DrrA [Neobacillus rhizosphaerae]|uniref:Doxorubicin resistance ATP-binding protein DrrA n=1 Tax=Neobacillus rhizosphaerae TaxID=2880965 RepID=A0ABM9EQ07_9BACI|nr:ATP-binding cassette domain-containing protein [Neobacillus rhizosphaerae]CAH2714681.1 Doxorubicin resistance ATP-binding protein DrrA [Neobacillus rhizosphaerae]
MNDLAIVVNGLQKKFGKQVVLDGIDLDVQKGEIFALLGPNGAGKTTFINILSTLVAPDAGAARVNGFDIMSDKEKVKSSISLTGQFAAVDEMLTAEENLRMMARLSGLSRLEARSRANELIEQFDLTTVAQKRVKTYSGGLRRRLDLAVSLVVPRSIIFLDEPTTGLDTRSRRALWDIILHLATEGVTIFLTTQYLEEADKLADTIAVISKGRIVGKGTPEEMKSRIGKEMVELRNDNDEIIREIPTSGSIQEVKQILEEVASGAPEGTRISIRRPSLDDVFLLLTSEKGRP